MGPPWILPTNKTHSRSCHLAVNLTLTPKRHEWLGTKRAELEDDAAFLFCSLLCRRLLSLRDAGTGRDEHEFSVPDIAGHDWRCPDQRRVRDRLGLWRHTQNFLAVPHCGGFAIRREYPARIVPRTAPHIECAGDGAQTPAPRIYGDGADYRGLRFVHYFLQPRWIEVFQDANRGAAGWRDPSQPGSCASRNHRQDGIVWHVHPQQRSGWRPVRHCPEQRQL